MGKASSAKKVARLTSGSKHKSRRTARFGFPALITVIVVGGILSIVFLKSGQPSAFPKAADLSNRQNPGGDHIHEAYGFNICGKWQPPIPEFESQIGIHTHGDGVIHIHPYDVSAQGRHAELKVFLTGAHVQLSDKHLVVPKTSSGDGANVKVPGTCNGKPAVLRVAEWHHATTKGDKPTTKPPDKVYKSGFGDIWLGHNGGALTIYYGPPTGVIPLPDYQGSIQHLVEAEGGVDKNVSPTPTTPGTPAPGVPAPTPSAPTPAPSTPATPAPAPAQ